MNPPVAAAPLDAGPPVPGPIVLGPAIPRPVVPLGAPLMGMPVVLLTQGPPWFYGPPEGDRSAILGASIETPGIARRLNALEIQKVIPGELAAASIAAPATTQGGGNLNGSANTALLYGQAGTNGQRIATPRAAGGNYCGVV